MLEVRGKKSKVVLAIKFFDVQRKRLEAVLSGKQLLTSKPHNGRRHESFLKGSLRENFFSKKFSLNNGKTALKGAGKTRVFPALPYSKRSFEYGNPTKMF